MGRREFREYKMSEVRCQNQDCRKAIALKLEGTLEFYCPRCHTYQKLTSAKKMTTLEVHKTVDTLCYNLRKK